MQVAGALVLLREQLRDIVESAGEMSEIGIDGTCHGIQAPQAVNRDLWPRPGS